MLSASWTNKDRLSDEALTNLIEHFPCAAQLVNVPDDQLKGMHTNI
jgi:type I restriction enzyme M protein